MKTVRSWFEQDIKRVLYCLVAFFALIAGAAFAAEETVNQGTPGLRGPWTVTGALSGTTFPTTPQLCTTSASKSTTVGVAAVTTPATQLTARRYIIICNSPQNTGTPLVKCRVDGTPVMAVTNPGEVLGVGDCFQYAVAASVIPSCISDTATTYVISYECS